MKLLLASVMVLVMLLAFRLSGEPENKIPSVASRARNIIRCSPDWNEVKTWIEETDIPLMPGAGDYKWKITTKSDSAQFYFNQGINMYYSFHIIEAMASFKKAARFDPAAAMLSWAQALAYGPNINDLGYAASPDALLTSEKAIQLSTNATNKEKELITAQRIRYSADSTVSRTALNQLYADAMKKIHKRYPADADIAALYADALMLQHPWDLWNNDGTPKPWTPLMRQVLEKLLSQTPSHPGANHYYIHVMEASPYAAKALPSADRLGRLTPGLSHTVHMPSHIYLRTGNYEKGSAVNEEAVNDYQNYLSIYSPVSSNDFLYLIHNLHMQTNNAMLAGRSAYAVKSAEQTRASIQKDYLLIPGAMGNVIQYIYMTPVQVDVRFGRWKEILASAAPDPAQIYSTILYRFGKGMAHAHLSQLPEAKQELNLVRSLMKDSSLLLPFTPFSPAIGGATVAENLLAGTIALKEKDNAAAIRFFIKASETEENMVYNEPRDWLLSSKHYLADAYLHSGKYKEVQEVLRKDLRTNNDNVWALRGLYLSYEKQGQLNTRADLLFLRYRKASDKADIQLTGPVID